MEEGQAFQKVEDHRWKITQVKNDITNGESLTCSFSNIDLILSQFIYKMSRDNAAVTNYDQVTKTSDVHLVQLY